MDLEPIQIVLKLIDHQNFLFLFFIYFLLFFKVMNSQIISLDNLLPGSGCLGSSPETFAHQPRLQIPHIYMVMTHLHPNTLPPTTCTLCSIDEAALVVISSFHLMLITSLLKTVSTGKEAVTITQVYWMLEEQWKEQANGKVKGP